VRAAILYQSNGWSFEQVAFELAFHAAYRGFCRLGLDQYPSKRCVSTSLRQVSREITDSSPRSRVAG
jgi:hypothetical protein